MSLFLLSAEIGLNSVYLFLVIFRNSVPGCTSLHTHVFRNILFGAAENSGKQRFTRMWNMRYDSCICHSIKNICTPLISRLHHREMYDFCVCVCVCVLLISKQSTSQQLIMLSSTLLISHTNHVAVLERLVCHKLNNIFEVRFVNQIYILCYSLQS